MLSPNTLIFQVFCGENKKRKEGKTRRGGGERGIRTPDGLLTHTRFPGVRLKPLGHLSAKLRIIGGTRTSR